MRTAQKHANIPAFCPLFAVMEPDLLAQLCSHLQSSLQWSHVTLSPPCLRGLCPDGHSRTCLLVPDSINITNTEGIDVLAVHDGEQFHLYSISLYSLSD